MSKKDIYVNIHLKDIDYQLLDSVKNQTVLNFNQLVTAFINDFYKPYAKTDIKVNDELFLSRTFMSKVRYREFSNNEIGIRFRDDVCLKVYELIQIGNLSSTSRLVSGIVELYLNDVRRFRRALNFGRVANE